MSVAVEASACEARTTDIAVTLADIDPACKRPERWRAQRVLTERTRSAETRLALSNRVR